MNDGFVDIQVNGYGGVNFNQDHLTAEQLQAACVKLHADGVAGILATIISEKPEIMQQRIGNIVRLRGQNSVAQKMIRGIHIEGPFLSADDGYRGAHPRDVAGPVQMDVIQKFYDICGGILRIFTLSPEQDEGCRATAWLTQHKVVVSGGHSNASMKQLEAAVDNGLAMWTHLGNGCPMQMHRHDNIIQRVLRFADRLWICFIGDGTHVPLFALKNYLRVAGLERVIVTTDCMAAAGMGPGRYQLGRWEVEVGDDMVCWAPDRSHFVGSAATMRRCAENLSGGLGLSEQAVVDLLCNHPALIAAGR